MTPINTNTEAVERLLDGVTPGPWHIKDCAAVGYRCTNYYQEIWNDETDILVTTEVTRAHNDGGAKNMRFIAAARDLVPALLRERDEARAALAASQPADPATNAGCRQPVRVKPLVWDGFVSGCYLIEVKEGGIANLWRYSAKMVAAEEPEFICGGYLTLVSIDGLKAAAQADYEANVLAALEPAPVTPAEAAKVQALVDALEFYADRDNYEPVYERMPCDCCTDIYEPVKRDEGDTARAALAAWKEATK